MQNRYPLNQWQEIIGNCDTQLFRLCQADLIVAGDLPDQFVLEHLQPCAQPDDDAAAHRVGRLPEDVVGGLCRVGDREQVEEAVQFLLGVQLR